MTVFITSSPYIEGADRAMLSNNNGFVDRIREVLPPTPRALFVAADPENREMTCRFAAETCGAFCQAGIPFSAYEILDAFNADEATNLVASSDLILLSGGHVPTQNAFFQDIGLREILEDFDGTVVGISAGSMNCADEVYVQPEEAGESDPDFERFAPGLALTDINILPHYQKVRNNILDGLRLFEDLTYTDSMGRMFFALPDNSYFVQDDDSLLLFGEAYRIMDGEKEQICESGAILDMDTLDMDFMAADPLEEE